MIDLDQCSSKTITPFFLRVHYFIYLNKDSCLVDGNRSKSEGQNASWWKLRLIQRKCIRHSKELTAEFPSLFQSFRDRSSINAETIQRRNLTSTTTVLRSFFHLPKYNQSRLSIFPLQFNPRKIDIISLDRLCV